MTDAGRRLEGKVALVTGASRGIGAAISRRFGSDGARVALAARDDAACRRIAGEIEATGGEAFAVRCDVTDRGSIAGAVAAVVERWGRIDVLVNNAGLGGATPLDDPDDSLWDAILATNLSGVFRVTREAASHISDGGRVINLSSVVGRFGVAGHA
ncbi:MAG: SDR family NAD(P)-dependent oxidoreductase, partial [Acidobacteriota bacterium]